MALSTGSLGLEYSQVKIAYAHIYTYAGLSLGASHWYGSIQASGCTEIVLTMVLTAQAAERLNKQDRCLTYRIGNETGRFPSQDSVREEAIKVFGQSFPSAVLLIEGDICCMDPQHVLIGPPVMKARLNSLVGQAQKIGYWERDERTMQKIATEWDSIIDQV